MKVTLYCCTHDRDSKESEEIEVPDDTSDEELDEIAKEFFYSTKEPEWWWEKPTSERSKE